LEKLFKNGKAMSPVVASIILIAVAVAVSLAVAAWMGALTFTFTNPTYEIEITKVEFLAIARNLIGLTIKNTGTSWVEVISVRINNEWQGITYPVLPLSIDVGSAAVLNITYTWMPQYNYQFDVQFTYNPQEGKAYLDYYKDVVAPSA